MTKRQNRTSAASKVDVAEATPQTPVVDSQAELLAYKAQVAELEKKLAESLSKVEELNKTIVSAKRDNEELHEENKQLKETLSIAHKSVVELESKEEAVQKELKSKAEKEGNILASFDTPAGEVVPTKKFAQINGVIYNFTSTQEMDGSVKFSDLDEKERGKIVRKFPHIFKLKK